MNKVIVVAGKRKAAVAKASINEGKGEIRINKVLYSLLPKLHRLMIEEPLILAKEKLKKLNFDIRVNVKGGGHESQIEAARLAIAKAIVAFTKNNDIKKAYLAYDRNLLVADIRRKEAYKPGDSKARSKRQKSYR